MLFLWIAVLRIDQWRARAVSNDASRITFKWRKQNDLQMTQADWLSSEASMGVYSVHINLKSKVKCQPRFHAPNTFDELVRIHWLLNLFFFFLKSLTLEEFNKDFLPSIFILMSIMAGLSLRKWTAICMLTKPTKSWAGIATISWFF